MASVYTFSYLLVFLCCCCLQVYHAAPVDSKLNINDLSLVQFHHEDRPGMLKDLEKLEAEFGELIDVSKVTHNITDLSVYNKVLDAVLAEMKEMGYTLLKTTPYSTFPKETVASELKIEKSSRAKRSVSAIALDVYHTYSQINEWLDLIGSECGSLCSVSDIGTSIEERTIKVIKIGKAQPCDKPKMFIDCGIHAREWIAPAVCLYLISQLLNSYGTDTEVQSMVDKYDWHIIPVMNPDGYSYTMTDNRLWRKNRRVNAASSCVGVDLNRNWGSGFGRFGSSSDPCRSDYRGAAAFSEPETKSVALYALSLSNIQSYLTFHSYGQDIVYPWGYTSLRPADWKELGEAGEAYNTALHGVYGSEYDVGTTTEVIYYASGISHDWFYGRVGAKFSYAIELRDNGTYGHVLPDNEILPTAIENFTGLKGFISYLEQNNKISGTGSCDPKIEGDVAETTTKCKGRGCR